MKLFGLLLLLCVGSWLLSSAHLTNAAALNCMTPVVSSTVRLNSLPVTYPDSSAAALGVCSSTGSTASCPGSGAPLGDGVLGSGSLDNSQVFAWNRDVVIDYQFSGSSNNPPHLVNLYFYNEPTASPAVGLPIIQLTFDTLPDPVHYVFLGNQDVKESDSQYRSISLAITTALSDLIFNTFSISMSFLNTNLNWVALSEIELCAEEVNVTNEVVEFVDSESSEISLGPDPVVSTVDLSCTVVNQGLYSWQWSFEGALFTPQTFSDATRTSTITVSSLSAGSAGLYQCQTAVNIIRNITVNLNRNLVAVESPVSADLGGSAVLSCELYGYLGSGSSPAISWQFNSVPVDPSLIQEQSGTRMIQNGGASPIMSVISVVTLENLTSTMFGTYFCKYGESSDVITLEEIEPSSSTPAASQTTTPNPETNLAPIIGGVVGGMVTIIVLLALVTILVVCYCKYCQNSGSWSVSNRGTDTHDYGADTKKELEPTYAEVRAPPVPNRDYHLSPYSSIDMVDQGRSGTMELSTLDKSNASMGSIPSVIDDNPMPVKLQQTPVFLQQNPEILQDNPMYLSADHLNQDESFLQSRRRQQFGSIPEVDTSMLNIYAASSLRHQTTPQRLSVPELCPIYSEPSLTPAAFGASTLPAAARATTGSLDLCPYSSIYTDPRPLRRSEGPLEVTHQNIREIRVLGTGQFGEVVLAGTIGISLKDLRLSDVNDDKGIAVQVAIKKLKRSPSMTVKETFEKEIKFMSRLKHDNVVRLLAICSTGNPFIVMEYMENGDLNQYLKKFEFAFPDQPTTENKLSAALLLYMCLQISSGLRYLASLKFVHRDLATRNCLVGEQNIVKIADFGMSRSLYDTDYYKIRGRAMLPIRWMAYDCFYGRFSEKSDVWAFGIVMWEIFTFAKRQPYDEMTDQEVINDSIKGANRILLSRPDTCPEEVFEVMLRCWVHETEERANFEEVYSSLASIYSYSSAI